MTDLSAPSSLRRLIEESGYAFAVIEEAVVYVGGQIPVAAYERTGSVELASELVGHLAERGAVLMANHGMLCVGKSAADGAATATRKPKNRAIHLPRRPRRAKQTRRRVAPRRVAPRRIGPRRTILSTKEPGSFLWTSNS